ncbi:MAG: T9SS sorting signal type C domain-containing protein [Flavobacterium sp.]
MAQDSVNGYVTGASAGNVTITGNTFKNITNTGSGSFFGYNNAGSSVSGTLNFSNNTFQDITYSGAGSLTGYFNNGSPSGTATISGNTFRNISNTVCSSGSWIKFVHSNTVSSQIVNVFSNTIENLTLNPATTSTGVTAIHTQISSNVNIYNNSIKNITSAGANSGIITSASAVGTHAVYGNTIDGMTSPASGALINHYGIYTTTGTGGTSNIFGNKVYNISSGISTNATIYGIYGGNGTSNISNVYNNMVGDLKMPNVTNSTTSVLRGIHMGPGTNTVYNNSVYLNAVSSGSDFSSTAFCFSGTGTVDLRNNILVNNSTPNGVGYAAAIMKTAAGTNGTVPTPYSASSNNNCLYAPSVANGVIYVEGQYTSGSPTNVFPANCVDINAFKAFVASRETNSFSEMPPFISTTAGSMDLHLNIAASSGCFDGGTTVAIASPDIDGNARPMGAAYEIGADEASGTNSDKTPPTITYTPLSDVGCSSATTLTATITDANAIGSGVNAPRLYFKKLSDPINTIATANNSSVGGWKYVVATGSYTFTLNYALLPGGLVQGDIIQYFVAAQDISGNVATTSATVTPCVTSVAFTSSQTVSSPPTINQFTYRANLSGNYTVGTGSGQNFPTLSGTGGLFDAINKGYVTGNITATVTSNTVETGAVSLNEWAEYDSVTCALTGTSVYRLTVQSDGTVRTLEGANLTYNSTSLKAMINLNGADRVTFTGGSGTQRNLVFRTTNTAAASCVPVFQMGNVNGSNDIIINNCDIQTNGTSGAAPISAGIYITNTGTNANNLFQNNDIRDAVAGTTGSPRFGIYAENNTATVLQIRNNNIKNIYNKAIVLGVSSIGDGQVITDNSIFNDGGTTVNNFTGIELTSASTSGHTITGNYIGGTQALGGLASTPWTTSAIITFVGINLTSGTATQSTVSGNVIRNINLSVTTAAAFTGIGFSGNVSCTGNTIGGSNFGITINGPTANAASSSYGIIANSAGSATNVIIDGNTIGNITHYTSSTAVTRLHAINVSSPASSTVSVSNNTIDNITSNMKSVTANAFATTTGANAGSNVIGIIAITAGLTTTINTNTISNLSDTGVTGTNTPSVLGIAIDGSGTNTILRNKIYNLSNQSPGSAANPASIIGIRLFAGTSTTANNMITLTNGANTNASRIVGIWDNGTSTTVHFNSIVIGGSQAAGGTGGLCSAAYACLITSSSRSVLNNILINTRTGGTAGSTTSYHYALAIPSTATSFTSNYNNLVAGDTSRLCLYNGTSHTIATWRASGTPSTPDLNSQTITPTFTDVTTGDLHIVSDSNCTFDNKGIAVAITSDFDVPLITRGSPPDIGADEFTSDFKLNLTPPPGLRCSVSSVDLTASGVTTGGLGSTAGATLTYWTDSGATVPLASPNAVTAEGTYYIKSVKGTCSDIKPITIAKQGTTWVGGAWVGSGGYPNGTPPDIDTAVVIDDNYDTSVNGSFEACSLTINSPATLATACALTIKPGVTDDGFVTVENDLTVNTNGSLLIENKGSLIMNNDSGVVTNNGTTQAKRTTTPFERYDYVYWSAPLKDTRTLSSIFNGWRTDYSFTFNTQNFADISPADSFDDNGDAWVFAGPSATMAAAKGYAVMTPTSVSFSPSATPVTVTFNGAANNGVIPIRIYESANPASTTDDYNFIGNPYPSAISARKFIIDNGAKTSGTLYFWTHVADISVSNPGPGVANFITADYALYNLSGGTASGTGSTQPSGFIGSGQGFFVEAESNNVDVLFNNAMRKRDTGYRNDDFFRTSSTGVERNRLWLNLENPDGLFSQLLVGYFEQTTLGFDWAYDGRVNASNTQVSFYSLEGDEKYKIQARPEFTATDVVPLGYFSIANGQFTITLGQKEGVFATNQDVYLEDRLMNVTHNLTESPYTFTTSYGRYEDRFFLRYADSTLGNPGINLDNSVVVSTNNGQMAVKSQTENIQEVIVYDILGRQLFEAKNIGSKNFMSSDISMSQQALIVKIKLENGAIITRKIIL